MITALDTYIWDAVCQTLAYWKKDHLYVVPISINVSVADIETINVPEFLQDLIIKYGLTASIMSSMATTIVLILNHRRQFR